MATESISIKFYLNNYKPKAGKLPIYTRLIYNRRKAEIATDFFVHKTDWDEKKQRVRKNDQMNEEIATIEKNIYDTLYKLRKEKRIITAHSIKSYYTKKDKIDISLLDYFNSHIDKITIDKELIKSSITRYEDTRDHLKEFLEKNNLTDLSISQVQFKLISDFDSHLLKQPSIKSGKTLERNTVNKHHSRLRTVLIRAIKEGELVRNPYYDLKLKYTPSKRTFLSHEELKKISDYSFSHNRTLEKVRDIFLFSVYTGLRFQDAQNLRVEQITTDQKKNYFFNVVQNKTQQQQQIPLLKPAQLIFNKYDNDERKITGKILPKISNQKLNTYLKEIAVIVGVEKTLSHHVARHTCATTILLSNEVPIEGVAKWLGHSNIRTAQIYGKITADYLTKMAKKIEEKI